VTKLNDFSINAGYKYKSSIFHKSNNIIKTIVLIIMATLIIVEKQIEILVGLVGILFIFTLMTKFNKKDYLKIFKLSKIFSIFIIFSAFFRPSYEYIYKFYFLTISVENGLFAVNLFVKMLSIILIIHIFSSSTPIIESILKWGKVKKTRTKISKFFQKFKIDKLIATSVLAVGFIPYIVEEFNITLGENKKSHKKYSIKNITQVIVVFIAQVIKNIDNYYTKLEKNVDINNTEMQSNRKLINKDNIILMILTLIVLISMLFKGKII
jgi:energy-coupling factor transporter transmembrane protein EcfT